MGTSVIRERALLSGSSARTSYPFAVLLTVVIGFRYEPSREYEPSLPFPTMSRLASMTNPNDASKRSANEPPPPPPPRETSHRPLSAIRDDPPRSNRLTYSTAL